MKYILILTAIIFIIPCYSQENQKYKDSIERLEYITTFDNELNLRSEISTSIFGYLFQNSNSKESVHLIANERLRNKITLSYKKISLGFSFSPNGKPFNDDDELKGHSKTIGYNLAYTSKKFTTDLFYNNAIGFYVFNTEDFRTQLNNDNQLEKFIKVPNFASLLIGIESSYYFNGNKYSIRFAKNQSEVQTRSVGSVIAYSQLLYSEVDGRNQEFNYLPVFSNEGTNFRMLNTSYYALFGLGYGYNYIINKNIYITGALYPSAGGQYNTLKDNNNLILDNNFQFTAAVFGELAGGYQYKNLYGGGYFKFGAFNNIFEVNQLSNGNFFIMGYIGYRFKAPKFLLPFENGVKKLTKKSKKLYDLK